MTIMEFNSREQWGAKAPLKPLTPWVDGAVKGLVVHWVGGGPMYLHSKTHAACLVAVRGIADYERSRGYIDIAYNFLVCPHGIVIEGRGSKFAGAANGGGVNNMYGSVCLLMGQGDPFGDEYHDAVESVHDIFGGGLLSHRQVNATQCPGDEVAAWVFAKLPQPFTMPIAVMPQKPNPSPGGELLNVYLALHRLGYAIKDGPTVIASSRGQSVKDVQFALVGGFGQNIPIDAVNGPKTIEAIKNAQRFGGVKVDGIVGLKTRAVLSAVLLARFP